MALQLISSNDNPPAAALDETPPDGVNHDLVESLQTLLEGAQAGTIVAMAWSSIHDDMAINTGWASGATERDAALLGAILLLDMDYSEVVRARYDEYTD